MKNAIQSVVYLLCSIDSVSIMNDVPNAGYDVMFFYNSQKEICGTLLDIVWMHWKDGKIPNKIGSHSIHLVIPKGWQQIINGNITPFESANAEITIVGLVINYGAGCGHDHLRLACGGLLRR